MPPRDLAKFWRNLALAAGCAAANALSVLVSLGLTSAGEGASPIWTANSFVAAALLLLPVPWAAASAAVCFVFGVLFSLRGTGDLALSAFFAGVNILEAVLTVWLARRACGPAVRLTSLNRVVRLLVLAILPACAAAALLAAGAVHFIGRDFGQMLASWFSASALGMSLFLPAMLLARQASHEFNRSRLERAAIYGVVVAAAFIAFNVRAMPMHFLLFPVAVLAAFRLGPRGAGFSMLLLTVLMVWFISTAGSSAANPLWSMGYRMRLGQFLLAMVFLTSLGTAFAVADQMRLKRMWVNRSRLARLAEARAQAAGAAKAEFLATMSHEIRTPMNSIIGFTEVLLGRDDLPETARRQLALIDQAGSSLLAVVNDILDVSKIQAGEIELSPRPCTPRALAEDALAIVADSARRKGLATEVTVTGEADAPLMIDDLRVRQILLNLLSNAIKFTPQGQVSLTLSTGPVEAGQRRLRFEITDTGVGVAPDKLDRLFKRFSQADGSVSRAYGGTGLGLAISKGLAEQMGGRIGVESRAGEGSCFWFEITAAQAVADDEAAEGGETDDLADLQGAHVLLVDDHPMNRELGHTILGLLGCQVDLADGGAAAIEAARNGRYDAVLMDLHMPHMDGFEAARRIRALEGEAGRVPIIALSADVMPATLGRCLEAGMVDAAPKPIQIQVLYEVLTRWVGRTADGQARAA